MFDFQKSFARTRAAIAGVVANAGTERAMAPLFSNSELPKNVMHTISLRNQLTSKKLKLSVCICVELAAPMDSQGFSFDHRLENTIFVAAGLR